MTDVVVTQVESALEIQFNRPEKKNALTRAMYQAVEAAFARADEDPGDPRGVADRRRRHFHQGNDIRDFQARAAVNEAAHASPFLTALSSLAKPLVAAVNGAAIGVGTTMLAHADPVIAARSARFVMPFTSLGLVPEAGKFAAVSAPGRASAGQRPVASRRAVGCGDRAWLGPGQSGRRRRRFDEHRSRLCVPPGRPAAGRGAPNQGSDQEWPERCARADRGGTGAVPPAVTLGRGGAKHSRRSWRSGSRISRGFRRLQTLPSVIARN